MISIDLPWNTYINNEIHEMYKELDIGLSIIGVKNGIYSTIKNGISINKKYLKT